nr:MAG TPA: hypothetical protein [Siphoviridae sp. ctngg6]
MIEKMRDRTHTSVSLTRYPYSYLMFLGIELR